MAHVNLAHGDCLAAIRRLPSNSIDAIVTDPPYGFEGGFMGQAWDRFGSPQEFMRFSRAWATECFRVLKPGGYLVSFCSTKMYHWMAVGIELAGFLPKDLLAWLYSSGWPKSYDLAQSIEKIQTIGAARRPDRDLGLKRRHIFSQNAGLDTGGKIPLTTPDAKRWEGWGTCLKPALEPVFLAQKPVSESNYAKNLLKHGVGGLNIDGCRVELESGDPLHTGIKSRNKKMDTRKQGWRFKSADRDAGLGRFPANVMHDNSPEVLEEFAQYDSPKAKVPAARFFYCTKTTVKEKTANKQVENDHPTVKPLALMRYLVRLVCPKNGVVLDPFMGSGTTALACIAEGMRFVGVEREQNFFNTSVNRVAVFAKDHRNLTVKKVRVAPENPNAHIVHRAQRKNISDRAVSGGGVGVERAGPQHLPRLARPGARPELLQRERLRPLPGGKREGNAKRLPARDR